IALNLKGLAYDIIPVDLLKAGGAQHGAAYRQVNPAGLVPVLVDAPGGVPLLQSLAIIEYLEETHPQPPLLPAAAADRAYVRAIALAVACDIHPLNNLRVLRYLKHEMAQDDAARDAWYRHWCEQGLATLEALLAAEPRVGDFCYGSTPTLADCCLIPQIANAQRAHCDLSAMPTLLRINQACLALDAFARAAPASQPDAG
ncbi:MAG: maleylacetoacetate isomerase, partial [Gallionellales bacterium RBG_16_56_9]